METKKENVTSKLCQLNNFFIEQITLFDEIIFLALSMQLKKKNIISTFSSNNLRTDIFLN